MNNKYTIFLLSFVSVILLSSCNKTIKEVTTSNKTESKIENKKEPTAKTKSIKYEKYDAFYNRFHKDSLFQMSRVNFPIGGYYLDTVGEEQKWNETNWIMHRSKIQEADTSIYKISIESATTVKKEKLFIEGGGFKIERKFQLLNGKWHLIFYSDENL